MMKMGSFWQMCDQKGWDEVAGGIRKEEMMRKWEEKGGDDEEEGGKGG